MGFVVGRLRVDCLLAERVDDADGGFDFDRIPMEEIVRARSRASAQRLAEFDPSGR